ncbi:IS110 family transposase, partial [Algoriphagus sp. PAP.12]|uniref:IS110 family transposase n=1 Tax=Algoriphagus sp. PAP.12 TaxID=2996678 RepID=UPI00227C9099
NARHIKNVPGHKTDKKDSEWIAKLLLSGLLKGSFVPAEWIRELRDLCRYKRKLIAQRVAQRNRVHKILEDANIKLASVVSDVFGISGTLILDALIQKQNDPEYLANLAKGSLRKKMTDLKLSLHGRLTDHHRFMLSTLRDSIDSINSQIRDIELRIESYAVELQQELDLLQTIPGVGKETAMNILAETGNDMGVFPDHKHLASWAGVSPGNNESAGKKKSTRITHGNKYLKTALVEAAWAASHTKDTYLNRKHGAIAARRGTKKALIAVAHKILTALYFILKNKESYLEPDDTAYQEKRKQAQIKKSLERLRGLGVQVDFRPN